ncbi:peptidoglycan-binding protein [Kovacikia minuta CCNUW1]|uniref:peptidoglycan-binding domain-containing protein n=1 Tax=Kovacikia minuta TaxID=2931930 RepID=UPI001CCB410B|nr:peptidoglycan-binding protein [Kovacikia minuta]UBF26286.1 peptidoglycan-binding protein [Kovacikia minuta CCNUW1]
MNKFPFRQRRCEPSLPISLVNLRPVLYPGVTPQSFQKSINELQSRLKAKGYSLNLSGRFDLETESAVRQFQKDNGLFIDGVVGVVTWICLCYPKLSRNSNKGASQEIVDAIADLQKTLREGPFKCSIKDENGYFGKDTEAAVKVFQQKCGLKIDGTMGTISWIVLLGMSRTFEGDSLQRNFRFELPQMFYSSFLWDQLLKVTAIVLGMYYNPFPKVQNLHLSNAVTTAYALTFLVPLLIEYFPLKRLSQSGSPLLQYGPYVGVGIFWYTIFEAVGTFIGKMVLK